MSATAETIASARPTLAAVLICEMDRAIAVAQSVRHIASLRRIPDDAATEAAIAAVSALTGGEASAAAAIERGVRWLGRGA